MTTRPQTIIIVPCYNEEKRLNRAAFELFFADTKGPQILFVNDGSRDATQTVIDTLAQRYPDRILSLALAHNKGKAEAVRQGILSALEHDPWAVGYWDADLSTPLNVIPVFRDILDRNTTADLVMGARVKLLGRNVQRNLLRHYAGRVFATTVSSILALPVYDTQCGAKLFRNTSLLKEIFARPFTSRWIFDVEILARMMVAARRIPGSAVENRIIEQPLQEWVDVRGSKLNLLDYARAVWELARVTAYLYLSPKTQ